MIRCPSVGLDDVGTKQILRDALDELGFTITRLRFGRINDFFAQLGSGSPHFCFAGHTDVVPAGEEGWLLPAFSAEIKNGMLFG